MDWVNGDALRLPFRDSTFDVVTVSYGLRNLADVEWGLREMHRVARPRGRLLVLDFGKPRPILLRAGYFAYLRFWVPVFGRLLCGDAATHAYILESLRDYPAQDGVAALMQKLPCRQSPGFEPSRRRHEHQLRGKRVKCQHGKQWPPLRFPLSGFSDIALGVGRPVSG